MKKCLAVLMVIFTVFMTFSCKEDEGDKGNNDGKSFYVELNKAKWGPIPENKHNTDWPTVNATSSYSKNILTFTFDGRNRQRGVIPLTAAQEEILKSDYSREKNGVTIRIDATVKLGTKPAGQDYFTVDHAGFRTHIGDPSVTQKVAASGDAIWWNATAGNSATEGPLSTHLVEYRGFDHAFDCLDPENMDEGVEPWSNFKSFIIQAMFKNSEGNTGDLETTFPEVIVTIKSIKIELGDTRTAAEKE